MLWRVSILYFAYVYPERLGCLQYSRASGRTLRKGAERVRVVSGNAHGESREGSDAGVLKVGLQQRVDGPGRAGDGLSWVADGEDCLRVVDSQSRSVLDLHATVGEVHRLDEARCKVQLQRPDLDLSNASNSTDGVSLNLVCY